MTEKKGGETVEEMKKRWRKGKNPKGKTHLFLSLYLNLSFSSLSFLLYVFFVQKVSPELNSSGLCVRSALLTVKEISLFSVVDCFVLKLLVMLCCCSYVFSLFVLFCLFVFLFVCLFPLVCLFVCLFVCFVCLFVSLFFFFFFCFLFFTSLFCLLFVCCLFVCLLFVR